MKRIVTLLFISFFFFNAFSQTADVDVYISTDGGSTYPEDPHTEALNVIAGSEIYLKIRIIEPSGTNTHFSTGTGKVFNLILNEGATFTNKSDLDTTASAGINFSANGGGPSAINLLMKIASSTSSTRDTIFLENLSVLIPSNISGLTNFKLTLVHDFIGSEPEPTIDLKTFHYERPIISNITTSAPACIDEQVNCTITTDLTFDYDIYKGGTEIGADITNGTGTANFYYNDIIRVKDKLNNDAVNDYGYSVPKTIDETLFRGISLTGYSGEPLCSGEKITLTINKQSCDLDNFTYELQLDKVTLYPTLYTINYNSTITIDYAPISNCSLRVKAIGPGTDPIVFYSEPLIINNFFELDKKYNLAQDIRLSASEEPHDMIGELIQLVPDAGNFIYTDTVTITDITEEDYFREPIESSSDFRYGRFIFDYDLSNTDPYSLFNPSANGVTAGSQTNKVLFKYGQYFYNGGNSKYCFETIQTDIVVDRNEIFVKKESFCSYDTENYDVVIDVNNLPEAISNIDNKTLFSSYAGYTIKRVDDSETPTLNVASSFTIQPNYWWNFQDVTAVEIEAYVTVKTYEDEGCEELWDEDHNGGGTGTSLYEEDDEVKYLRNIYRCLIAETAERPGTGSDWLFIADCDDGFLPYLPESETKSANEENNAEVYTYIGCETAPLWHPVLQVPIYFVGDTVSFNSINYVCIQAAYSSNTPLNTDYWLSLGPCGGTSVLSSNTSPYSSAVFYVYKPRIDGSLTLDSEYCYGEDSIEIIESHDYTITKITALGLTDQLDYINGNTWKFRTKDVVNANVNSEEVSWDFYYEDDRGCTYNKPSSITINPRPRTNYTVDNVCFGESIKFIGSTDYPNNTDSLTWKWNFDDSGSLALKNIRDNDIPVPDNINEGRTTGFYTNPVHKYANAGLYSANLKVSSENGCATDSTFEITVGSYPQVNFEPTGFVETNSTSFENLSEAELFDPIDTLTWNFDDPTSGDNTLTQFSIQPTSHKFETTGVHDVALTMITETGCESTDTVKVPIFPKEIVTTDNTYEAVFDDFNQGWLSSDEFDKGLPSGWKLKTVASPFNISNTEGRIWQTGDPADNITNEKSWVESPAFDISGLDFPLLSMDIYQSVEAGRDGAALQYTLNDGETWNLLGDEGEGVNWYDTRGIVSNPGSQTLTTGVGWSLDEKEWKTARYTLDDLKQEIIDSSASFVRFRIAYASDAGNAPGLETQGFAFDNFTLSSRNRVVMIEQFVNSVQDKTLQENEEDWLDAFLVGKNAEVVDMRYHNYISNDVDPLFNINPPDISSRSMEYGATRSQLTMVDGIYRCLANSEVEAKSYYKERTLTDIAFDIDNVTHIVNGDNLSITADITKLKDDLLSTGSDKCVVRMAIVQHGYEHNGETYKNVVVELLPNGEGNAVATIPADFPANETMTVKGTWTPNVTTKENEFRLVVYVQGIWGVDEVHQVWFKDSIDVPQVTVTPSAESLKSGKSNDFTIYPSPVKEKLNLNWKQTLENPVRWKLVSMSGTVVKEGTTAAGEIHEEIETYQLNKGIYLLLTEDQVSSEVEQRKILIVK